MRLHRESPCGGHNDTSRTGSPASEDETQTSYLSPVLCEWMVTKQLDPEMAPATKRIASQVHTSGIPAYDYYSQWQKLGINVVEFQRRRKNKFKSAIS